MSAVFPSTALFVTLRSHPDGLGIDAISAALPAISRRTLQRQLAAGVQAGQIEALFRGPARRYRVAPPAPMGRSLPNRVEEPTEADWRTPGGQEVERLINRPLAARKPVGYNQDFLSRYRPNADAYLSQALREHLHVLGRSPGGERPAGTYARQILHRLLIDLSWASSRLEGNTYTRLDTQNLIEFGRVAEGKDQREALMVLNHKAAIELVVEDAATVAFNRFTLQNLHALLADGLLADASAGGRIRTIPVSIHGTAYEPTGIPQVIEACFDRFLAKADAIEDPFEQAFFAMVHLPYLQPFEDVNKRVSRVAANIPFIKKNLAPLSFVDIPEKHYVDATLGVYELTRVDLLRDLFAWAYERSCQRFTVLREALPAPDPLRMHYRAELGEIVRETVRQGAPIEPAGLRGLAREIVAPADLDAVIAMAFGELHQLHDGNIARFGLRLSEFRAWAARVRV